MRRLLALALLLLPLTAVAQQSGTDVPFPWALPLEGPSRGPLYMVSGVEVVYVESDPKSLTLKIKAVAPTPGYSNLTADPILTFAPSPDGIYDAVLLGTPPSGPVAMVLEDVEFEVTWQISELPNVLRLHANANCIALLLAQPEPAPDIQDCEVLRPAGFPPGTQG